MQIVRVSVAVFLAALVTGTSLRESTKRSKRADHDTDNDADDSSDSDDSDSAPAPAAAAVAGPALAPAAAAPAAATAPPGVAPDEEAAATVPEVTSTHGELEANMGEMLKAEMEVMTPDDPNQALKQELSALYWLEEELKKKYASMDEEAYRVKIMSAEMMMANETTPGVAKMLGDMRRDMHKFAAPFYRKVLLEQLDSVQAKQKAILDKIEKTKKSSQIREVDEEVDEKEPTEAPTQKPTEAPKADWSLLAWALFLFLAVGAVVSAGWLLTRRAPRPMM